MQIEQIDRDAAALGDLPSRMMGWAGKARANGLDRIELDLATVDRLLRYIDASRLFARPDDSADVMASLQDPVAVHVNMLRGTIAIPDLNVLAHVSTEVAAMVSDNKHLRAENAALRGSPDLSDDSAVERVAAQIARDVAELGDRSSPDDKPDMMLVTAEELTAIVVAALGGSGSEEA